MKVRLVPRRIRKHLPAGTCARQHDGVEWALSGRSRASLAWNKPSANPLSSCERITVKAWTAVNVAGVDKRVRRKGTLLS